MTLVGCRAALCMFGPGRSMMSTVALLNLISDQLNRLSTCVQLRSMIGSLLRVIMPKGSI